MTIEEKLKGLILTEFKSVREFVNTTDLPYGTVDGILRRGINNSSVKNVIKLCKALGISADELANNKIVPANKTIQRRLNITEINDIVAFTKRNIEQYHDLTIDGEPVTMEDLQMLMDGMELTIELIRRRKEREK